MNKYISYYWFGNYNNLSINKLKDNIKMGNFIHKRKKYKSKEDFIFQEEYKY